MDPNKILDLQLTLAKKITNSAEIDSYDARDLAEYVIALHEWIKRGGFLPAEWQKS